MHGEKPKCVPRGRMVWIRVLSASDLACIPRCCNQCSGNALFLWISQFSRSLASLTLQKYFVHCVCQVCSFSEVRPAHLVKKARFL